MECLGGFSPLDYVSEKIKLESTNVKTAFEISYEIYDAEIDTTNYLDYASMTCLPNDTYRNFYKRLVGFVRQHLPDKRIVAEGVTSPDTGESLTIGLLDLIAIHWMLFIDKRLISTVKTEFTEDLKSNSHDRARSSNTKMLFQMHGHQKHF